MVSNQDYMPVECLLVPKALFKEERYCSLSTTAKVLYSLMLDRLKYAAQVIRCKIGTQGCAP